MEEKSQPHALEVAQKEDAPSSAQAPQDAPARQVDSLGDLRPYG
jgi:hypothetical protein